MSNDSAAARNKPAQSSPSVVILMGVSGSGKSTVGTLLAERLNWTFADADQFHPPVNVEKMHKGIPLTDDDRWPWLHAIAAWIDETHSSGGCGVIACSALKREYRDVLVGDRADIRLVYLNGTEELIADRLSARHGHFMPPSLLRSQFVTLEEPTADEKPIVISIVPQPNEIVVQILSALNNDESLCTGRIERDRPAWGFGAAKE